MILARITYRGLCHRATNNTDANGVTITNTFDDLGRVLTRAYPDGGIEKFGYSIRGLIAYTCDSDSRETLSKIA